MRNHISLLSRPRSLNISPPYQHDAYWSKAWNAPLILPPLCHYVNNFTMRGWQRSARNEKHERMKSEEHQSSHSDFFSWTQIQGQRWEKNWIKMRNNEFKNSHPFVEHSQIGFSKIFSLGSPTTPPEIFVWLRAGMKALCAVGRGGMKWKLNEEREN